MKDEIKEILNYFIKHMSIDDCIRLSKIEDYITNLQEDLEKVSGSHFKIFQENKILQEENEKLKFYLKVKSEEYDNLEKATKLIGDYKDDLESDYENYKSRNKKAIEYINEISIYHTENGGYHTAYFFAEEYDNLLNILEGSDKDE